MMSHRDIPLTVLTTRPNMPIFKGMPPCDHQQGTWQHICPLVTNRQLLYANLWMGGSLGILGFVAEATFTWFPLLCGPLPELFSIVGIAFGKFWIGWIGVAISGIVTWLYFKADHRRARVDASRRTYRQQQVTQQAEHDNLTEAEVSVIEEEIWFREGAENWSLAQRLDSHIRFVMGHCRRPYLYPLPLLSVYAAASVWLMHTYRRTYRQTKSRQEALLAASVLHLAMNCRDSYRYANSLVWMLASSGVLLGFGVQVLVWIM